MNEPSSPSEIRVPRWPPTPEQRAEWRGAELEARALVALLEMYGAEKERQANAARPRPVSRFSTCEVCGATILVSARRCFAHRFVQGRAHFPANGEDRHPVQRAD